MISKTDIEAKIGSVEYMRPKGARRFWICCITLTNGFIVSQAVNDLCGDSEESQIRDFAYEGARGQISTLLQFQRGAS